MKLQKVSRIDGTFLKEHKNTLISNPADWILWYKN